MTSYDVFLAMPARRYPGEAVWDDETQRVMSEAEVMAASGNRRRVNALSGPGSNENTFISDFMGWASFQ
jgi:hypothetical protein